MPVTLRNIPTDRQPVSHDPDTRTDTDWYVYWKDLGDGLRTVSNAVDGITAGKIGGVQVRVFTASTTYTPTSGLIAALFEAVGGGGGGGEVAGSATYALYSGGGGAGGYSRSVRTAAQIGASQSVTIGALGAGGVVGVSVATAGGDTSVGAFLVAKGGAGCPGCNSAAFPVYALGGVVGSGDFTTIGSPGSNGFYAAGTTAAGAGGNGGASVFGGPGAGSVPAGTNGNNAAGYGSGGGGAGRIASASNASGGNGATGVVIVTEFLK